MDKKYEEKDIDDAALNNLENHSKEQSSEAHTFSIPGFPDLKDITEPRMGYYEQP
ncbi:hypothetical protein [Peribacillus huizhouensis]|uniref:Uncharacterized protein n=1 Tax=Peribacillus huizhouensis TaxID=1501239 RepID=A0ABR6CMJ8_9BACI|nr:hypothetical protein [Peribacillus huizhouensis]MBA9026267.1 hypothetical protein [Peribacillus huizhouensis]